MSAGILLLFAPRSMFPLQPAFFQCRALVFQFFLNIFQEDVLTWRQNTDKFHGGGWGRGDVGINCLSLLYLVIIIY